MKAQGLRIGNKVRWDYEIYTITAISTDVVDITRFGIAMSINIKSIKPIPLTEEWLVKFGFVKNDCDNYELEYTFKLNASFTIINKDRGYFYIDAPNHEIKYVHQLQNLYFALTGEEL